MFRITDVINFWFNNKENWYVKDKKFDDKIRENYLELYKQAKSGMLESWKSTPEGILALVIILDQFSRNMFRNTKEMFSSDDIARSLAFKSLELGYDKKLSNKVKSKVQERNILFVADQKNPILNNHALHGKYKSYRSISITGNIRAVYKLLDKDTVLFVEIGTHSKLYS